MWRTHVPFCEGYSQPQVQSQELTGRDLDGYLMKIRKGEIAHIMDDLLHEMAGVGSIPCHLEVLERRSRRNTLVQLPSSSSDVGDPVSSKWWMVVHLTGVSVVLEWDYGFERNTMLQHRSAYPLNTPVPSSDPWNLRCRIQRRRRHDQVSLNVSHGLCLVFPVV